LADAYAADEQNDVHGTVRRSSSLANIRHLLSRVKLHYCDITDSEAVSTTIKGEKFEVVHHLAAISYLPTSYENPELTRTVNLTGTQNVLEAIRKSSAECVFHLASSSEVYAATTSEETSETTPLNPTSPYATAKVDAEKLCRDYNASYGLKTVITRAFTHTSERQAKHFFVPTVLEQAFQIRSGQSESFLLGNTMTLREYLDARDVANAYELAVRNNVTYAEPYNVASGVGYTGLLIVKLTAKLLDLQSCPIRQTHLRQETKISTIGNGDKFSTRTGWKRQVFIPRTLATMIKAIDPNLAVDTSRLKQFFEENANLYSDKFGRAILDVT
jgi:GDP-mannose 4,6-dehydratase